MIDFIKNDKVKISFAIIVLAFGLLGVALEILRAVQSDNFLGTMFVTFLYFTTQSNLLITIAVLLFILKKTESKLYHYLAFIALVNISITALIFHIILVPYMTQIDFIQQVLHTINPLLYITFYFVFYKQKLDVKMFWISLIYPLAFLITVYTIIEPVFGNYLETIVSDFTSARYIYPFLDPRNYERETLGVVGFNLGILAPFIGLLSLLLVYVKKIFDRKFLYKHE